LNYHHKLSMFLKVIISSLMFPIGWTVVVAVLTIISAFADFFRARCYGLLDCIFSKLYADLSKDSYLGEIIAAFAIGLVIIVGRLFELWLKDRRLDSSGRNRS